MYFIKGNEKYFINEKINDLIEKYKKEFNNDVKIHDFYAEINMQEVDDILNCNDIFTLNKLVIFRDLEYLHKTKNQKEILHFIELLNNLSENVVVIFTQFIEKNDRKFQPSDLYYFLEKHTEVIEVKKLDERLLISYIKNYVEAQNKTITNDAIIELIVHLPNDLSLIINEVNKLLIETPNITLQTVQNNNLTLPNDTTFGFINAFLAYENSTDILKKCYEQLALGASETSVINQIVSILVKAQTIYLLQQQDFTTLDISKETKIHSFQINLYTKFIKKIGYKKIVELLNYIADIDIDIKKGLIEEQNALKLIILTIIK
ncbi:DNA polymerase III subunit delta [Metamycoplasma cloacale]|uniref:DNA polymerase III delta subunit-like C-terminal domain-containing protein n=1 Tax=Metamycoplasma cloacale TaxID=92401 RepID=A0A2Z4LNG7_9BACT|nr:hypothetical protein [Metamycoplasma cloacale]AWX42807.1 hypothetical protein DK849_01880 [Metamycoplasma cloacale]VEU79374.1 DNA polymerase III subunit delta [Metamycoplasma cloacale]